MLGAPAGRPRELQGSVIGVRMVFHHEPADLHDAIAVTANAEVNGIGGAILRKVRTVGGVSEIAALAEFLVGRCDALVSRSRAVPGETIAERKTTPMRPHLGLVPRCRKEIRTGQEASQEPQLRDHCSLVRAVEI